MSVGAVHPITMVVELLKDNLSMFVGGCGA